MVWTQCVSVVVELGKMTVKAYTKPSTMALLYRAAQFSDDSVHALGGDIGADRV